jgi:hypothetical protein
MERQNRKTNMQEQWRICEHIMNGSAAEAWLGADGMAMCLPCTIESPERSGTLSTVSAERLITCLEAIDNIIGDEYLDREIPRPESRQGGRQRDVDDPRATPLETEEGGGHRKPEVSMDKDDRRLMAEIRDILRETADQRERFARRHVRIRRRQKRGQKRSKVCGRTLTIFDWYDLFLKRRR